MRLCAVCKAEIDADRLEALPDTRLCTEHGREIRDLGGEFIMRASQERTSKAGSLKLNYGGIATSKVRNDRAIQQLKEAYEDKKYFGND